MNSQKAFHFLGAGAAVLGLALCVPASMLAQSTMGSQDSSGMAASQSGSQSTMTMHHHRRHHSANRQLKRLTKKLNLTQDQQQQMLPILQDQQSKMKAMHGDTSLSPQQRREQGRTAMQETNQKLEAIMTDSQKQQYQEMMQTRHQRMHHDHMNHMNQNGQPAMGSGSGSGETAPPPTPQS